MNRRYSLIFPAWLVVCLLGALPFYFSGFFPNFTDAFFESVSGFTTTGATLVSNVEALPLWLLLWRSSTQWLGGVGILLTFTMLPIFSQGGFQIENNAANLNGKIFDRGFFHTAGVVILIYAALTALQFFLLFIFGMDFFDALTTSFSTISTGGFSVRNNGIAYYNSPAAEWVCAVFMFLAGTNLALIWLFLRGKAANVMRNSEARTYTAISVIAALFITVLLGVQSASFANVTTTLRQAFFHVTSIISTTGFYSADYNLWPSAAQGVLFFLLITGGCSFSAAGGIKIIRCLLLSRQTWKEMKRLVHPRGVFIIRLDGREWNKRAVHGAAGFVILYLAAAFFAALLVGSSGASVFTSINTALVCLGNIGRGLGELGAFMSFPQFPSYVKWGLSFVMILGRLELWIVLIIFARDFWRR